MSVSRNAQQFYAKISLEENLMHVNEVIWHEQYGGKLHIDAVY